ncbi:MAG: hypothetical protein ABI880_11860, partial [Acidobacteriota bacterium]
WDAPGRWKPWTIEVQSAPMGDLRFTAAEIKALEAHMLGLNAVLKAAPGVATPVGYSVETSGVITSTDVVTGQPNPRTLPLPSSLMFGAFGITAFTRNGKTVREDGGETTFLIFRINRMLTGSAVPDFIDLESDVMLELPRGADVNGMPRYGDQLVLQKKDVPLFTPVERNEALQLTVRALECRATAARDVLAKLTQALAEWRDPKQHAKRMADYTQSAALAKDPTILTKLTAFEKTNDATLAALAGPDSAAATDVQAAEHAVAVAKTDIAALPPADLASPSCFVSDPRSTGASVAHIGSAPAPGCTPIVRPNWTLYNAALPRTAPQLIVIDRFAGCLGHPLPKVPGNCAANKALIETLDVAAVQAWLR